MSNTNNTLQNFLESLDSFRLGMKGQNIDMDKVFQNFVSFAADETNDLFIYSDRENKAISVDGEDGEIIFVYTSFQEVFNSTFDGKNVDFLVNNAYSTFKDISQKENIEGIFINEKTEPRVFVPRNIIKDIVCDVDYLRSLKMN